MKRHTPITRRELQAIKAQVSVRLAVFLLTRKREMTVGEKAVAAIKMLPRFERDAALRMASGGTDNGVKGTAVDIVGGLFGISGRYIRMALAVAENGEQSGRVARGEISIAKAARAMRARKAKTQ